MRMFKQKISKGVQYLVTLLFFIMIIFTVFQYIPLPMGGMFVFAIFLLSFFLCALFHGVLCLGWRSALVFVGITFIICLFFECLGVTTGIIYGLYYYTDFLGYKLFNLVPIYIPIAWFMMIYASYGVSVHIVLRDNNVTLRYHIKRALVSSIAMTSWDLSMDPRLSTEWGLWVWVDGGPWFGVPIQNYIGWFITSMSIYIAYGIYNQYTSIRGGKHDFSILFINLPTFLYIAMTINEVVASVMIDQPILALTAALSMGSFSFMAILNVLGMLRNNCTK